MLTARKANPSLSVAIPVSRKTSIAKIAHNIKPLYYSLSSVSASIPERELVYHAHSRSPSTIGPHCLLSAKSSLLRTYTDSPPPCKTRQTILVGTHNSVALSCCYSTSRRFSDFLLDNNERLRGRCAGLSRGGLLFSFQHSSSSPCLWLMLPSRSRGQTSLNLTN